MRRVFVILIGVFLTAAMTAPGRAGEFEHGLDAFNAGAYAEAFAIWSPSARGGDAKSQASLGFLYYTGKGVQRDNRQSLTWFRLAAEAGQPTAQYYLGVQYFYGLGTDRDFAEAYSWCDIALTNGYSEGLSCRDAAELKMSPDDQRRSAQLTAEFFRSHEFRN